MIFRIKILLLVTLILLVCAGKTFASDFADDLLGSIEDIFVEFPGVDHVWNQVGKANPPEAGDSGPSLEWQKIHGLIPKVGIFVNGHTNCCSDKMYDVMNYFRFDLLGKVYTTPWDSASYLNGDPIPDSLENDGISEKHRFNEHRERFAAQLHQYISSLSPDTEIYLFGHSLGGGAVLKYLTSFSDPDRPIKFIAVFDSVKFDGYRERGITIPTHVENFVNIYQQNMPYPKDYRATGNHDSSPNGGLFVQQNRTFRTRSNGDIVRDSCGFNEICIPDGKKKMLLLHGAVPRDAGVQATIIDYLASIQSNQHHLIVAHNTNHEFSLSYSASGNNTIQSFISLPPAHGTLTLLSDEASKKTFQYEPHPGYSGADRFKVRLIDAQGNWNAGSDILFQVSVLEDPPNRSPVANNRQLKIGRNQIISFTVIGVNAYDPDGDVLTLTPGDASNGTVSVIREGVGLEYYPDFDFVGTDQFVYSITDPEGLSDSATITVDVNPPDPHLVVAQKTGSSTGDGTIKSNPDGIDYPNDWTEEFAHDSQITLTAKADSDSIFMEWDGACSSSGTSNTCTVTMDSSKQVLARFDLAPSSYDLNIVKDGNGSGTVKSFLPGIDCGDECTASYEYGLSTEVLMTARADINSTFLGWNGDCSGKSPCTIYMSREHNVTATFATMNPTTYYVTNLDDDGDGSLRQMVQAANANPGRDTITFSESLTGDIVLTSGQLLITDSVVIEGPGTNLIAVSGSNNSRIAEIDTGEEGSVRIEGLSLKEGNDISLNGGGGIIINTGSVEIENTVFSYNASDSLAGGGAVRKFGTSPLTIINSAFINNSSLDSEYFEGSGGAIRIDQGSVQIANSTFSANSSALGGAITIGYDASLRITNCTISENTALYGGAGIYNDGELVVSNNIISGNTSPGDNEINNYGNLLSLGSNIFGENGNSGITSGTSIFSSDLILQGNINSVLLPLSDNGGFTPTYYPVEAGSAVDNGENNFISNDSYTDQRGAGFYRLIGTNVDIGAVEKFVPLILPDTIQINRLNTKLPVGTIQGRAYSAVSADEGIAIAEISPSGTFLITGIAIGNTMLNVEDVQGNLSIVTLIVKNIIDGDIDGNGVIDLRDLITALQVSANSTTQKIYRAADVNSDGKINMIEGIKILNIISN